MFITDKYIGALLGYNIKFNINNNLTNNLSINNQIIKVTLDTISIYFAKMRYILSESYKSI